MAFIMRFNWYDNSDIYSDQYIRSVVQQAILKIDEKKYNHSDIWASANRLTQTIQKDWKYNLKTILTLDEIVADENAKKNLRDMIVYHFIKSSNFKLLCEEAAAIKLKAIKSNQIYLQNLASLRAERESKVLSSSEFTLKQEELQKQQIALLIEQRQLLSRHIGELNNIIKDCDREIDYYNNLIIASRKYHVANAVQHANTATFNGKEIFSGLDAKQITDCTVKLAQNEEARMAHKAKLLHKIRLLEEAGSSAPIPRSSTGMLMSFHHKSKALAEHSNQSEINDIKEQLGMIDRYYDQNIPKIVSESGVNLEDLGVDSSNSEQFVKSLKDSKYGQNLVSHGQVAHEAQQKKEAVQDRKLEAEKQLELATKQINTIEKELSGYSPSLLEELNVELDLSAIDLDAVDLGQVEINLDGSGVSLDGGDFDLGDMDFDGFDISDIDLGELGIDELASSDLNMNPDLLLEDALDISIDSLNLGLDSKKPGMP